MDYGFKHNGKVFTPNGTIGVTPDENAARNAAMQAHELAIWQTQPDNMVAYYHFPAEKTVQPRAYRSAFHPLLTGAYVSIWPGARIGTIVSAHVYPHNFGSRMVALTVIGSNGARYHGRASYDWGSCINLRKCR